MLRATLGTPHRVRVTCCVANRADKYSLKMGDDVEMIRGLVLGPTGSTVSITFQRPVGQEKKHHKPSGEGNACHTKPRWGGCEWSATCCQHVPSYQLMPHNSHSVL